MKKTGIFFAVAAVAVSFLFIGKIGFVKAAGVVISNINVVTITHSGGRIFWSTDTPSSQTLMWDAVSHGSASGYANVISSVAGTSLYVHTMFVDAALPSQVVYFRVCDDNGSGLVCSGEQSFTTAAGSDTNPAVAALPQQQVNTAMPAVTNTVNIASDCSNLISAFASAADGTALLIPTNAMCYGTYTFPASNKHIVIESAAYASLPSSGTRVNPSTDVGNMPKFINNTYFYGSRLGGASTDNYNCSFGSYVWFQDVSAPWKMKYCGEVAVGNITGVTVAPSYQGWEPTFNVTIPNHGLRVGDVIHISGVSGLTDLNGSGFVYQVLDANTIQIVRTALRPGTGQTYTSGGIMTKGTWLDVPYLATSGKPTISCKFGDYAFDASKAVGVPWYVQDVTGGGTYRCNQDNQWISWGIDLNNNFGIVPSFDFYSNAVTNVRLVGLDISFASIPADPLMGRFSGGPGLAPTYQSGRYNNDALIEIGRSSSVIIDRSYLHSPINSKTPRIILSQGDNVALLDNYILNLGEPGMSDPEDHPVGNPQDSAVAVAVDFLAGGPILLSNNHLQSDGITVFFEDGQGTYANSQHDIAVRNNYFYRDQSHFYDSPQSDGFYYPDRQLLEFKAGIRADIQGNVFNQNWRNVSGGAAIFLWGNAAYTEYMQVDSAGNMTTFSPSSFQSGDWIVVSSGGSPYMYRVIGVIDQYHFTLASPPPPGFYYVTSVSSGFNSGSSDFTIRNNIFENVPNAIMALGHTDASYGFNESFTAQRLARITVINNLFNHVHDDQSIQDPNAWNTSGGGLGVDIAGGVEDLRFEHNTVYHLAGTWPIYGGNYDGAIRFNHSGYPTGVLENAGLLVRNNILQLSDSGSPIGTGGVGNPQGTAGLDISFGSGNYTVDHNVVMNAAGISASIYPAGNFFPSSESQIGFNSALGGDFSLSNASPYRAAGSDGADLGVNMATLNAATAGVVDGTYMPPSLPTINSFTASALSITSGQTINLSWSVTGATSVSISPTVGAVGSSGSASITPVSNTTYTLTASNSGGTITANITVSVTTPSSTVLALSYVGRLADLVGQNHSPSGDGQNDAVFSVNSSLGKTVTSLTLNGNTSGGTWDTTTGGHWLLGAAYNSAGPLLNAADGSVNFTVAASGTFYLFASDNGASAYFQPGQTYTLNATFSDGSTAQALVGISSGAMFNISSFLAYPSSITAGQASTLSWATNNAVSVSISPLVGAVPNSGSVIVTPSSTTTYTLTATSYSGSTTSTRATVTVAAGSGSSTSTTPAPAIASFLSSPATVTLGHSATLSWSVSGVSSVFITGIGQVAAVGSQVVNPSVTTLYTLTARNIGGTVTGQVTVTVTQVVTGGGTGSAPTISSFSASKPSITSGQSIQLSWSTLGASTVTLLPSPGSVAVSGSVTLNPTQSMVYTLTATNSYGSVTSQVTVIVNNQQVSDGSGSSATSTSGSGSTPIIDSFVASPSTVAAGHFAVLSWSVEGVSSVFITGVGQVSAVGSQQVKPTTATTYTLTARNAGGTVTGNVTISIGTTLSVGIATSTPGLGSSVGPSSKNATTMTNLNVRSSPSVTGSLVGVEFAGSHGTFIGGPVTADGYTWIQVSYADGLSGWSVSRYIATGPTALSGSGEASGTHLGIGSNVITAAALKVRPSASVLGSFLGIEPAGARGVVTGGPMTAGGYVWYKVSYENGVSGWSVSQYLSVTTGSPASSGLGSGGTTQASFSVGSSMITTALLKVRATASISGVLLGMEDIGATGRISRGPISANGYTWWYVDYANGLSGWSVQDGMGR